MFKLMGIITVFSFFFLLAYAQEPAYQPAWSGCLADGDCGVVQDVCGEWVGVNKKFEASMRDYQKSQAAIVECVDGTGSEPKPSVFCSESVCHAGMDPSELDAV